MTDVKSYRSYRGLPTLAGLATIEEAAKPGLSVEACVARLKRYHYAFMRLHEILTARITAEPIYELKTGFSHHSYLCAEHVMALRTRVEEMREPPLGLEEIPHPALEIFFDEILAAPTTAELLVGVYETALPEPPPPESVPVRMYSNKRYSYDPIPKRDERFQDIWNQGVNPEAFIYSADYPAKAKALMILFKRLREIDVPEMMASIIHETKGKPWDYYLAMSRQLWDEARHAMMGEVGFVALGVDWTKARITHNWSLRLNTECTPIERHAVLYFIEQGLMTKTGKRYAWELGVDSGIPLVATIQDYDWADEVLHAQLGREWYIPQVGEWKQALAYGDQCWSRILSNWHTVREQGLTQHANWWPAIYRQACGRLGHGP